MATKVNNPETDHAYTGGCLCGGVRFEVHAAFDDFHLCHCRQCQQMTGAALAANLLTGPDALSWLQGQSMISRYDVPGRTISHAFCRDCGSALPFLSASGTRTIVPAGSLDQPPPRPPRRHIFWNERAPWFDASTSLPKDHNFGAEEL